MNEVSQDLLSSLPIPFPLYTQIIHTNWLCRQPIALPFYSRVLWLFPTSGTHLSYLFSAWAQSLNQLIKYSYLGQEFLISNPLPFLGHCMNSRSFSVSQKLLRETDFWSRWSGIACYKVPEWQSWQLPLRSFLFQSTTDSVEVEGSGCMRNRFLSCVDFLIKCFSSIPTVC